MQNNLDSNFLAEYNVQSKGCWVRLHGHGLRRSKDIVFHLQLPIDESYILDH